MYTVHAVDIHITQWHVIVTKHNEVNIMIMQLFYHDATTKQLSIPLFPPGSKLSMISTRLNICRFV